MILSIRRKNVILVSAVPLHIPKLQTPQHVIILI
jgi:hypothetical protein